MTYVQQCIDYVGTEIQKACTSMLFKPNTDTNRKILAARVNKAMSKLNYPVSPHPYPSKKKVNYASLSRRVALSGTGTGLTYSSGNSFYVTVSSNSQTQTAYTWTSSAPYVTGGSTTPAGWNSTTDVDIISHYIHNNKFTVNEGQEMEVTLPNGAVLTVNKDGSYEMIDDGKIIYKGCKVREFNRFINASDLLEEFIRFMGQKFNVRQGEILQIPIELFINWLIIRACQEDGDDIPQDVLRIEDHSYVKKTKIIPRCKYCGRFISRKYSNNSILFCNSRCMDKLIDYKLRGGDYGSGSEAREQHENTI